MYITFIPHNVPDNDLVSDDVLWLMSYKIYKKNAVEDELISFLDKRIGIAYPLYFWEENLDSFSNIHYGVNYPFKKELYIYEADKQVFSITLTALDIRTENCFFSFDHIVANTILIIMDLPEHGVMHPEKFHTRLTKAFDNLNLQKDKSNQFDDLFSKLDILCEQCTKYEANISWKKTNISVK